MSMIFTLWKKRTRPFLFSLAWAKTWTKRLLLGRHLLKQWYFHARLHKKGAKISGSAFFSDITLITGGALKTLTVGEDTFVGRAEISAHAKVTIGSRVCINDGVKILSASHDLQHPAWPTVAKPIVIEDYVWIATGAIILPGVTLGKGSVVGAGAVITRNVPSFGIAVGNPARILAQSRNTALDYSPTNALALFEAWMGRSV